jgi:nucleotide-binding universal stress UspA family protein
VVDKVVRHAASAVLVTRPSPGTRRIVVGTDFSDPSMPVLHAAADEQRRTGASVYAVHCVPPATFVPLGDPAAGVMPAVAWDEIEDALRKRIEEAAREAELRAAPQVLAVGASDGLVQVARDLAADLVIVGTHGRKGVARLALGSVAQHVVDHAPCPVLVVPLH